MVKIKTGIHRMVFTKLVLRALCVIFVLVCGMAVVCFGAVTLTQLHAAGTHCLKMLNGANQTLIDLDRGIALKDRGFWAAHVAWDSSDFAAPGFSNLTFFRVVSVSPDDHFVVLTHITDNGNKHHEGIYISRRKGLSFSPPVLLVPNSAEGFVYWSPDSQLLAMNLVLADQTSQLVIADMYHDRQFAETIFNSSFNTYPVFNQWTADGAYFVQVIPNVDQSKNAIKLWSRATGRFSYDALNLPTPKLQGFKIYSPFFSMQHNNLAIITTSDQQSYKLVLYIPGKGIRHVFLLPDVLYMRDMVWSPDDQYIALIWKPTKGGRNGALKLGVYNLNGIVISSLSHAIWQNGETVRWVEGGQRLVYIEGTGLSAAWEVVAFDLSSRRRVILDGNAHWERATLISWKGASFLILRLHAVQTDRFRILDTATGQVWTHELTDLGYNSISPDGEMMARFVLKPAISGSSDQFSLHIENMKTARTSDNFMLVTKNSNPGQLSWQPDSQQVAWVHPLPDKPYVGVEVIGRDGSLLRQFTLPNLNWVNIPPQWVRCGA
jgi:hypothetical protein